MAELAGDGARILVAVLDGDDGLAGGVPITLNIITLGGTSTAIAASSTHTIRQVKELICSSTQQPVTTQQLFRIGHEDQIKNTVVLGTVAADGDTLVLLVSLGTWFWGEAHPCVTLQSRGPADDKSVAQKTSETGRGNFYVLVQHLNTCLPAVKDGDYHSAKGETAFSGGGVFVWKVRVVKTASNNIGIGVCDSRCEAVAFNATGRMHTYTAHKHAASG